MKPALLFLFIFSLSLAAIAQTVDTANNPVWIEMMQDQNANFFETQKAFEMYWEGRERQPGDGWKVFKRWENYWADRVNPDGSFPDPTHTATTYEQWIIAYNQAQSGPESTSGDWEEVGPIAKPNNGTGQPNGNGRLNAICFHPTDSDIMWVGAPAGGLWKTDDGGQTWSSNTDDMVTLGVSSILIDPTNTNVMYMGTGDRDAGDSPGRGVYKSTNGGTTWVVSNSGMGNRTVGAMLMHPSNSSYLLAATNGGVYRSTNAGSSWSLESSSYNFKDMRFMPGNPNVVYATETSSGANFYRSTDGGDSWTLITSGLPSNAQRYSIGVSPADSNVVYLLCSVSSAFGGLYKSTDGGLTFTTQSTTPNILGWAENGSSSGGQGWYDLCMAVDPTDATIVYTGGVNVWKSTNSGQTWDCVAHWVGSSTAASVHADQHWLEYSPVDGRLYSCNDGGLYYTTDGGTTWPEISSGLGIAQIYRIGVSQNTHELVINGYQDNGTAIWDDTIFRTERGGDGMECIIDYSDDDVMYASVYYGNVARSLNNGYSFGGFAANNQNGITESGAWITPYLLDREDPNIFFIGYKNVWRTTTAKSASVTFTQISSNLGGTNNTNMRQLRQSKVNSNRLFALRSDNKLFRTDNALATSPTWSDLTSSLPGSGTVRDIQTHATNNNVVWIIRGTQVWQSSNGGGSWTNITGNLPSINKNCLVTDPLSNEGLYVGTDAGVYYIDNTLSNWITFDDGLPSNVEVTELEIYHPQGNWEASRIRAATYGRGLWESDLYDPGTLDPLAFMDLSVDSTDLCGSDTIHLYNNTAYGVTSSLWTITPSSGVVFVNGTDSTSMNPQIIITEGGSYDVKLVVSNSNGADSVETQDAITVSAGISIPWFDDFELNNACATNGCVSTCEVLLWNNLENGVEDDINWRVDAGGTPSSNTGPSVDYDPGTSTGNYLYVESSDCYNYDAILESPCIQLTQISSPEFKFAYHRYGFASWMNDLDLDIYSNGTWTNLWTQSGNQGNQWMVDSVSLSSYVGESVKLRFVGQSGSGWQSDMAIDDIEMTAGPYADFVASDTAPCAETTITLQDASTQSPVTWSWTITPTTFSYVNGTTSQSQNPEVEFHDNDIYTIGLQVSNQYGNDTRVKSSYVHVTQPSVTLQTNEVNDAFCPTDSVLVSVIEPLSNFAFYRNGNLGQNGTNNLYVGQISGGDDLYATATDSLGCTNNSDTITIQFHPEMSITLESSDDDSSVCEGDTVTFTATATNVTQYDFTRNTTVEQSGTGTTWTASDLEDGDIVWIGIQDVNGCASASDSIQMEVLPIPATPGITAILDSLLCSVPAEIYRWEFDGTSTETANIKHPKQGDGTYRVRIFEGGCWSLWSDPFIITGFPGLDDLSIKVYPSPASDVVYIEFLNGVQVKGADLRLIDMNGRTVNTQRIGDPLTVGRTEIPIETLPNGVYTIVLTMDNENYAVPIVKESR